MSDTAAPFQWHRVLLYVLIGSLVAAALIGSATLLLSRNLGRYEEQVIVSMLTVALFALTSLACVVCWERRRWRAAAVLGLLCSAFSFAACMADIWDVFPWPQRRHVESLIGLGITWSVLMPLLGLLGLARLKRQWRWTHTVTQVLAGLLALLITGVIIVEPHGDDIFRLIGVLAILTGCGTLCVPVLHWITGMRGQIPVVTTALKLTLTCPRCAESQELAAGRSKCRKCGLTFHIEIEEERCARCGYLLYKLTSDRCPECGTPVFTAVLPRVGPLAVEKGP